MERHWKIHKQRQDVCLVFSAQSVTFPSPDANKCTAVVTVGTNRHRGGYQMFQEKHMRSFCYIGAVALLFGAAVGAQSQNQAGKPGY
jgi:hypothetical protein